jgi:hypothetical protein
MENTTATTTQTIDDRTGHCEGTTVDWSRCERPAVRIVEGARYDGAAQALCTQHAKRAEKALAAR